MGAGANDIETVGDLIEAALAVGVYPSELIERVALRRVPSAHED